MSYSDFLLDKRVVHRNIAKGLVDKKLWDKHLAGLPNVEKNSEPCSPPVATESKPEATPDEG